MTKKAVDRMGEQFVTDLMWALQGPIICFPNNGEYISNDLKAAITMHRLLTNIERHRMNPGEPILASDVEVIAYLMTASLAQPLDHHAARIAIDSFKRYCAEKKVDVPASLKDEAVDLSDYEKMMAKDFRGWLFTKSYEVAKQRAKGHA